MEAQTQFKLGELSGEVKGLSGRMTSVEEKQDQTLKILVQVQTELAQQRGVRRTLILIGTVFGSIVGSAVSGVVHWVKNAHG